jgi:hypothetical protein
MAAPQLPQQHTLSVIGLLKDATFQRARACAEVAWLIVLDRSIGSPTATPTNQTNQMVTAEKKNNKKNHKKKSQKNPITSTLKLVTRALRQQKTD